MNRWTAVFFVLLRVTIGWHLLVEGLDKLGQKNWTSAPYLREATGPFAADFRKLAGDPVLDRMTVLPMVGDEGLEPPHQRLSPVVLQEWNDYFDAFDAHYHLDDHQRKLAKAKLLQREDQLVVFLLEKKQIVSDPAPGGGPPVDKEWTTKQRVDDYRAKMQQVNEKLPHDMLLFGKGPEPELATVKAQARKAGAALLKEMDAETQAMKSALAQASDLTPAQREKGPVPEPIPVPMRRWSQLQWSDFIVKWGLTLCGLGLLLGLFTRLSCLGGATLLLLFFLAMPPFPGVPDNPRSEGHYLFINKNIIEMLALLVLASTRSGRWVGLDGLIYALSPFRAAPVAPAVETVRPVPNPVPAPES
jgi:uncharacterized membrane protein YphA (DoxX/SURF4 family)